MPSDPRTKDLIEAARKRRGHSHYGPPGPDPSCKTCLIHALADRLEEVEEERATIQIRPSQTADTRTCDFAKVTKQQLLDSSVQHIADVRRALAFFQAEIAEAATRHDEDKLTDIDGFHADFVTGFERTEWWDRHRALNRHHLTQEDGIPGDVNLIDVLDFIADCVMAGMGRSGEVRPLEIDPEVLMRAFQNTADLLEAHVEVLPDSPEPSDPEPDRWEPFPNDEDLAAIIGEDPEPDDDPWEAVERYAKLQGTYVEAALLDLRKRVEEMKFRTDTLSSESNRLSDRLTTLEGHADRGNEAEKELRGRVEELETEVAVARHMRLKLLERLSELADREGER